MANLQSSTLSIWLAVAIIITDEQSHWAQAHIKAVRRQWCVVFIRNPNISMQSLYKAMLTISIRCTPPQPMNSILEPRISIHAAIRIILPSLQDTNKMGIHSSKRCSFWDLELIPNFCLSFVWCTVGSELIFCWKQLPAVARNDILRALTPNQSSKVMGGKTETTSWKMLKRSGELRGTKVGW